MNFSLLKTDDMLSTVTLLISAESRFKSTLFGFSTDLSWIFFSKDCFEGR